MVRTTFGARRDEPQKLHGPRAAVPRRPSTSWPGRARLRLIVVAACFAIGCGTMRPIDPGAGPIELMDGEGLVVLHVTTDLPIASIRFVGHEVDEPIPTGTTIKLIAATPGSYMFDSFTRKIGSGTWRWSIHRDGHRVRFDVKPGQINYPGALLVGRFEQSSASSMYLKIRVANRTSMVMAELERLHPGLQDRYPLRFCGGKDRFTEALAAAKADGAPPGAAVGSEP